MILSLGDDFDLSAVIHQYMRPKQLISPGHTPLGVIITLFLAPKMSLQLTPKSHRQKEERAPEKREK